MKSLMTKTMLMAATVVVAAGFASAQTMTAEIPFQFRAAGKVFAPGQYQVISHTMNGGHTVFYVRNIETRQAVALMPTAATDPSKVWVHDRTPRLAFGCVEDKCELAAAWTGEGAAYKFRPTKSDARWSAGLKTVELQPVNGE